jgi:hypothetical protein
LRARHRAGGAPVAWLVRRAIVYGYVIFWCPSHPHKPTPWFCPAGKHRLFHPACLPISGYGLEIGLYCRSRRGFKKTITLTQPSIGLGTLMCRPPISARVGARFPIQLGILAAGGTGELARVYARKLASFADSVLRVIIWVVVLTISACVRFIPGPSAPSLCHLRRRPQSIRAASVYRAGLRSIAPRPS